MGWACALAAGLALSSAALADTTVQVQSGSGDFLAWTSSVDVEDATPLTFRWSTTESGAAAVRWEADVPAAQPGGPPGMVASGLIPGTPPAGGATAFSLPASAFLKPKAPNPDQTFLIHVTAATASGDPVGEPNSARRGH